jgi:serine protease AprX
VKSIRAYWPFTVFEKVNQIDGYGTIGSPGIDPFVITVGAMNDTATPQRTDDVMSTFSSKGPTGIDRIVKPDLVAPGNRIFSAYANNALLGQQGTTNRTAVSTGPNSSQPGNFIELSGTSMSSPVVAGAALLLAQKLEMNATPDAIKAKLMKSASKSFPSRVTVGTKTIQNDIFTVGAGYLDLTAALNNSVPVPAGRLAQSPTAVFTCVTSNNGTRAPGCIQLQHSSMSLFTTDKTSPWEGSAVWGTSVILANNELWGATTASWGSPTVSGYSLLWGDSFLWGDSLLWGDSFLWGDSTAEGSSTKTPERIMQLLLRGDK